MAKILVVDDEMGIRELLSEILSDEGHSVSLAENAAAARRVLVEDGPGRPLGRSYRVKLWPTLVFLADGAEVARVVRPGRPEEVSEGLAALAASLD